MFKLLTNGPLAAVRAALAMHAAKELACEEAAAFLKRVAGIDSVRCAHCGMGQWRNGVMAHDPGVAASACGTVGHRGPLPRAAEMVADGDSLSAKC